MSDDRNESLNEDMSDFLAKMEFEAKHQNLDEITKSQPVPAPSTINECDTSDLYQVVYDITQYFGALGQNIPKTQMNLKMPPHVQLVKVYADHGVPGQSTMTEEDYACQTDDPIKLLPVHKTAVLTKLFGVTTEHPTVFEELQSYLSSVEVALKPTMDFFNQIAMAMRTTNMIDPNGFNLPTVPSVTMPVSVFKLKQAFDPNGLVSIDNVPTVDAVSQMTEAFQGHVAQLKSSGLSNKFAETVSVFLNANPESLALRLEAMAENGTSKLSQMLTEAVNNIHETMGRAYSVTIIQRKMHELLEGINEYGSLVTRLRTEVQGKPYPVALVDGNNGLGVMFYAIGMAIAVVFSIFAALVSKIVMMLYARKGKKDAKGFFDDLKDKVKPKVRGKDGKLVIDPPGTKGFRFHDYKHISEVYKKIGDYQSKANQNLPLYLRNHSQMMSTLDIVEILKGDSNAMKDITMTQMRFHTAMSKAIQKLSPDYLVAKYNSADFYNTILVPGRAIFPMMIDHALTLPKSKISKDTFSLCHLACSKYFTLANNKSSYDLAVSAMAEAVNYSFELLSWISLQHHSIKRLLEIGPQPDESKYLQLLTPRPMMKANAYKKIPKATGRTLEKQDLFFQQFENRKMPTNHASFLVGKLNLSFSEDAYDYPTAAHEIATSFLYKDASDYEKMSESEVKSVLSAAKKAHHFNIADIFDICEKSNDVISGHSANKTIDERTYDLQSMTKETDKTIKDVAETLKEISDKHARSNSLQGVSLYHLAYSLDQAILCSIAIVQEITLLSAQYLRLDVRVQDKFRLLQDIPRAQLEISGALAEYADAIRDGG